MKIEIDTKNVQEDILSEFIIALENATGCKVKVNEIWSLEVNDPKAAAVLQTIFGGNHTQAVTTGKIGKKPGKEKRKNAPHQRVDIKYQIQTGKRAGQSVTGGALGVMLKAGSLEAGTRLSHPVRGELIVVTNGAGLFTLQAVPA